MRIPGLVIGMLMLAGLGLPEPSAAEPSQDGVTALIRPNPADPPLIYQAPSGGTTYGARIAIFQKVGDTWSRVGMPATLHVLAPRVSAVVTNTFQPGPPPTGGVAFDVVVTDWLEVARVPFTSSASGFVKVLWPKGASAQPPPIGVKQGVLRVIVEFQGAGVEGRTSEGSTVHSQLMFTGLAMPPALQTQVLDAADALDQVPSPVPAV